MPKEITTAVWIKNTQNNEWFDFLRLNLDAPYFSGNRKGVFMIWYVSPGKSRVIKIGSGILADQLKNIRTNPQVLDFTKNGPLKVSWVTINGILKEEELLGVERYLYDTYSPLIGEKSLGDSIKINLL